MSLWMISVAVPMTVLDIEKKPQAHLMISIKMLPPHSKRKEKKPTRNPTSSRQSRAVKIKCCQRTDMWNHIHQLGRRGYHFPCFPSSMSDVTERPGSQLEWIVRDCCCHFSPLRLMFAGVCSRQLTGPRVSDRKNLPLEALCKTKTLPWRETERRRNPSGGDGVSYSLDTASTLGGQ